jgi:hypothetical protein
MRSGLWLAVLVSFVACAPSVPRPARKPPEPDAGIDLALATTEPAIDARGDGRTSIAPAIDARGDGGAADAAADARGDLAVDARGDANGDTHNPSADGPRADAASDVVQRRDSAGGADADADAGHDTDGGAADAPQSDGPIGMVPSTGDLAIDELLINPAGTDTNREWIEVVNRSAFALDLRLLHVADAASDVAVDAGILAPGGLLVLGQSLDPTKNGGAPISFSFGNVISLNNAGDAISLCLGPCAEGLILDQVTWTADLGAAYDGHAAIVGAGTGADAGDPLFCAADLPFGTAGSFGTPGAPNPPCGG